jgi:hypothetical protein
MKIEPDFTVRSPYVTLEMISDAFFVLMRRFLSETGVRNSSYKKLGPFRVRYTKNLVHPIRLVGKSKPLLGRGTGHH